MKPRATVRTPFRVSALGRAITLATAFTLVAPFLGLQSVRGADLPAGFQETVVLSGLNNPTAVQFASDGRVFVAEKRGVIKIFDGLGDTTPTTFADLRTETSLIREVANSSTVTSARRPTAPNATRCHSGSGATTAAARAGHCTTRPASRSSAWSATGKGTSG